MEVNLPATPGEDPSLHCEKTPQRHGGLEGGVGVQESSHGEKETDTSNREAAGVLRTMDVGV